MTGEGGHCSFCGASRGPFATVEGLFTVWICIPCLEVRHAQPDTRLGLHDSGPYPPMTPAEMRESLALLPSWVLEQKAAAFSVPTASELLWLLHGCRSADHRPCPPRHLGIGRRDGEALAGLAWQPVI